MKLLILIISLLISLSSCHIKQIILDEDTNFVVSWDYSNSNITFELEGDFKGWFAFGYRCTNCPANSMAMQMGHPDLVAVTFDSNGVPTVYDMIESMDYDPMQQKDIDIGGQSNILTFGGYQGSHHSLMYYTRKLVTGDTVGDYDIDLNADFSVTWYIGKDNKIDFDNPLELGTNNFNLVSGEVVEGGTGGHVHGAEELADPLFAWHAALMSIAFGVLIPFGIFSARYLKSYQWGFYLHIVIQSTALAFIIVGFVIILVKHDGVIETENPHSILGVILAAMVFAVGAFGVFCYFWKPKGDDGGSKQSNFSPSRIHGYAGKIIALLSVATIITGLRQYLAPVAFIIVYSILILTYFIIGGALEIHKRFYGSTPGGNVKMENFN
ncbi:DOMON related domain-containing protein [Dictyostelium discoideum AX4]|uniref:Ferric-chelate reductase fr1A n=1 Tax=Dictyostelium discoideum TaxID=44689 RepID=FR1A_DICDI|nr:DOMON related domain-containing protein [Dictyostelium discoideum AX4]EAL65776.1 DOMON related domain-containing protein [Dictyostelium discoideum AX4]|eukprot:XP_639129.1 DOMON related domain-containing protein [Dictyostelium discoideum AX4]